MATQAEQHLNHKRWTVFFLHLAVSAVPSQAVRRCCCCTKAINESGNVKVSSEGGVFAHGCCNPSLDILCLIKKIFFFFF